MDIAIVLLVSFGVHIASVFGTHFPVF